MGLALLFFDLADSLSVSLSFGRRPLGEYKLIGPGFDLPKLTAGGAVCGYQGSHEDPHEESDYQDDGNDADYDDCHVSLLVSAC